MKIYKTKHRTLAVLSLALLLLTTPCIQGVKVK